MGRPSRGAAGDAAPPPGGVLLSIEATKTETALRAERDGRLGEALVHTGSPTDAEGLLVVDA